MNLLHLQAPARIRQLLLGLALLATTSSQAQVGPGMSPIVTWDYYSVFGSGAHPPTSRALSAPETALARQRAVQFFDVLKRVPEFSQPATTATYLTSWAVVTPQRMVSQSFVAYASDPRDARRRADGALWGVLGGSHQLMFMDTNLPPNADKLAERQHNDFARQVGEGERTHGYFVQPQVVAELGGGQVLGGYLLITRDGKPALGPVPIGTLLDIDIARHRKTIAELESGWARSLRELDATMTPEAIVARRAKREAAWQKETRDPAAMAKRLDAAARADEADAQRQREFRTPPAKQDPRSTYWAPRLALQALERQAAALDAAGRQAPACGWRDTNSPPGMDVRWAVAGAAAPPQCLPMVQVRPDLLAGPKRPDDVLLFTAWLGEEHCGLAWHGDAGPRGSRRCAHHLPLLRGVNWAALRQSWGW